MSKRLVFILTVLCIFGVSYSKVSKADDDSLFVKATPAAAEESDADNDSDPDGLRDKMRGGKDAVIDPPGVVSPYDDFQPTPHSSKVPPISIPQPSPLPTQSDGKEAPPPTLVPVVKHYVFNEGENFNPAPTPTPFIDFQKFAQRFTEKWAEGVKNIPSPEEYQKKILEQMQEPTLSSCLQDKTDSIPAPEDFPEGLMGENSPFQDMLFIEGKDLPDDADLIFGPTTITVPFVRGVPNTGWSYITEMGVPCLPFRIRLQGKKVYFDQGLPALKNYSLNPAGEYHPYIKSLYKLEKGK